MKNLEDLLEKAKWGKLSNEELAYVVQKIETWTPADKEEDLYTLIHTLGRSEEKKYKELVERFLYFPDYPMITRIALYTLCNYWNYTQDYLSELTNFIQGVEWDKEDDVRLIAISCAGGYLRKTLEKKLLQLLIDTFEKNDEDELIREGAYEALCRAMGKQWNEILASEGNKFDFSIIERARKALEKIKNKQ